MGRFIKYCEKPKLERRIFTQLVIIYMLGKISG